MSRTSRIDVLMTDSSDFYIPSEFLQRLQIAIETANAPMLRCLTSDTEINQCFINTKLLYHNRYSTLLHIACGHSGGNLEIVKILVEAGIDINSIDVSDSTDDNCGDTALTLACMFGYEDIVDFLIDKKAKPTSCYKGCSPLITAIEEGFTNMALKLMRAYPEIVDIPTKKGNTPLIVSAEKGNLVLVHALIKTEKVDTTVCLLNGDNILHISVRNGFSTLVDYLIKKCPELAEMSNAKGLLPVDLARECGNNHFVEKISELEL